jgi:hypothetical protein
MSTWIDYAARLHQNLLLAGETAQLLDLSIRRHQRRGLDAGDALFTDYQRGPDSAPTTPFVVNISGAANLQPCSTFRPTTRFCSLYRKRLHEDPFANPDAGRVTGAASFMRERALQKDDFIVSIDGQL